MGLMGPIKRGARRYVQDRMDDAGWPESLLGLLTLGGLGYVGYDWLKERKKKKQRQKDGKPDDYRGIPPLIPDWPPDEE